MSLNMKDIPISERPYEKLELYGPQSLSNSELLAIIIKTGTKEESAVDLAKKIMSLGNEQDLNFLREISLTQLTDIKGIGKVKAIQIKAVCELTTRMGKPVNSNKVAIKSSKDVFRIMQEMRFLKREIVKVIILNTKNIVKKIVDISFGATNSAIIDPKDVLSEAVKMEAPKIILVHNHPSGDATPSEADYEVTDRIYECAELMGISLLDHIIISKDDYQSIFYAKSVNDLKENDI